MPIASFHVAVGEREVVTEIRTGGWIGTEISIMTFVVTLIPVLTWTGGVAVWTI